ncbi:hypothetical protein Msil_2238 [Methylocella silvestris BL2]|uniref:Uncharacterized protein n=1 Tax=Methylocella silvestris (strain DSM 15510 / CIP 108128 / LMG 27833 / NCIMB 13906 / BL2) TaxID=395965 RepID=B8ET34_METSB|nr:hypothetical protein [Methylocella silvestris]ACK51172.1 hypothetical protein Msil_2238 [Methylocella silvestris BL2]
MRPSEGAPSSSLQITHEGLTLAGVLLAKRQGEELCLDEERIVTLLAIAQRARVADSAWNAIGRASKHWGSGDRALAAIHLTQIGLRKLDEDDRERVALAAALLDAGMSTGELTRELGLTLQPEARKYSDAQPRVPAGNSRASGQWTSGDGAGSAATGGEAPVVDGRSASSFDHYPKDVPKEAIAVILPDGRPVIDYDSPTGKLMAPPHANFNEVYTAGKRSKNILEINDAIGHYGKFDFQRDGERRTYYVAYKHASNYAVGVYMAGAGFSREETINISENFSYYYSSNYEKDRFERKYWTSRGWNDAHFGAWK